MWDFRRLRTDITGLALFAGTVFAAISMLSAEMPSIHSDVLMTSARSRRPMPWSMMRCTSRGIARSKTTTVTSSDSAISAVPR